MRQQRWLHGPVPDLLLGCGLGYALIFAMQAVAGDEMRVFLPLGLMPLITLVSATPHYGATLLRVYERREARRAHAIFTVWVTLALAALFVAALHSAVLGSWLLTVYLTWSPWHYSGQNYGIALLFLRRRGVSIEPLAQRLLYASFVLSFLLTVLAVHGEAPAGSYAPSPYGSIGYRFINLGIPTPVVNVAFPLLGAGYLLSVLAAGRLLLRGGSLRALGPTAAVVGTQALWFSVPTIVRYLGVLQFIEPLSFQHMSYTFLWIVVGHSIQYLWVATYYARRSGAAPRRRTYLLKTLLAGAAIWTVPALLFAPGALGGVPFGAGLDVLIASAVNLHHFVLDGAIWKLRDGRVARFLVRGDRDDGPIPSGPSRGPRLAPGVWAVGAVCVAVTIGATLVTEFGIHRAFERGDTDRMERAIRRLGWVGRDDPSAQARLAWLRAKSGDWERGLREVDRSLALYETADSWSVRGSICALADRPEQAIASYREALRLSPGDPGASNNLAWLLATHTDPAVRSPREAVALAEEASRNADAVDPQLLDTLAAAYAAVDRFAAAQQVAARAHHLAQARGDRELAGEIESRMRLYAAGRPYRE